MQAVRALYENRDWSAERIRRLLEDESVLTGQVVSSQVWQIVNVLDGGSRTRGVVPQLPGEATEVDGAIFGINTKVNFFSRFHIPDTPIARRLLGEIIAKDRPWK